MKDIFFDKTLTTDNENVKKFANDFVLNGYNKDLKRDYIVCLIANLRKSKYNKLIVPQHKNDYVCSKQDNLNAPHYKYSIMKEITLKLEKEGYITINNPFHFLEMATTIESTDKLWYNLVNIDVYTKYNNPLLLRKTIKTKIKVFENGKIKFKTIKKKINVDYRKTKKTEKIIEQIKKYNSYILNHKFELLIPIDFLNETNDCEFNWICNFFDFFQNTGQLTNNSLTSVVSKSCGAEERGVEGIDEVGSLVKPSLFIWRTICPSSLSLHRVFNAIFDGVCGKKKYWVYGGRFYGSLIQNIPHRLRKFILIDGEKTCEPDFCNMQVRLLYHLDGLEFSGDAYGEKNRDLVKLVSLICLNSKNKIEAKYAIKDTFVDLVKSGKKYDDDITDPVFIMNLITNFEQLHKPIKKYFYTNIGCELQAIESNITSEILNEFISNDKGIVSIHDSFRIRISDKDECIKIMNEKYFEKLNFYPLIKR